MFLPELACGGLSSQSANLPPEINKIDVPDLGAAGRGAAALRLTLRWDVTTPSATT